MKQAQKSSAESSSSSARPGSASAPPAGKEAQVEDADDVAELGQRPLIAAARRVANRTGGGMGSNPVPELDPDNAPRPSMYSRVYQLSAYIADHFCFSHFTSSL